MRVSLHQGGVDDVAEVGVMVLGGMCGLSVGNMLSAHVNPASFRKAMVVLIAMSSASLITSQADPEVQLWTTVAFAVLSVGHALKQHMFEHFWAAEQTYHSVSLTCLLRVLIAALFLSMHLVAAAFVYFPSRCPRKSSFRKNFQRVIQKNSQQVKPRTSRESRLSVGTKAYYWIKL